MLYGSVANVIDWHRTRVRGRTCCKRKVRVRVRLGLRIRAVIEVW